MDQFNPFYLTAIESQILNKMLDMWRVGERVYGQSEVLTACYRINNAASRKAIQGLVDKQYINKVYYTSREQKRKAYISFTVEFVAALASLEERRDDYPF